MGCIMKKFELIAGVFLWSAAWLTCWIMLFEEL